MKEKIKSIDTRKYAVLNSGPIYMINVESYVVVTVYQSILA